MRQTAALIRAYKAELRKRQLRYRDLATLVELSEASIKRMLSTQSLTLDRLETLCDAIDITLLDLMRAAELDERPIKMLEEEQESEIANNNALLVVANGVLNGLSFNDIISIYRFTKLECTRLLAKLDQLGVIELLPGNHIRLRLARNFRWRTQGPIERLYAQKFEAQFLQSQFNEPGELKLFASAMLSRESNAILQRQTQKLIALANELHEMDAHLPKEQRFGSSLLVALRPWEPEQFQSLRREADTRKF